MERHRTMSTYFWNDPYVETLSPHEKLVYVYLCFNQNDNNSGIYQISRGTIAGETGIDLKEVIDIFSKLETDGKIKYIDNIVAIKNRIKNQNLKNTPIRLNILKCLKSAPEWAFDFVDLEFLLEIMGINKESLRSPEGNPSVQGKGKGKSKGKDSTCSNGFNGLKFFIDEYLTHRGIKYPNADPGRDGKLIKEIIRVNGVEKFQTALSRFWVCDDSFVVKRKFDVVAFNSLKGILLTEDVKEKKSDLQSADEVIKQLGVK